MSSPRGTSDGTFDNADAERFDVAAAIEYAEFHEAPELPNRWLVGWSFGTDLALMYGNDPSIEGAILLSPPLRYSSPEHLAAWADSGKPLLALVPELDDDLRPAEARNGSGQCRWPRSSAWTVRSTCGSASRTCGASTRRSSAASTRPRCR